MSKWQLFPLQSVLKPLMLLSVIGLQACATSGDKELVRGDDIATSDPQQNERPHDLMYHLLVGEFAGVRGDLASAVEHYQQAAELNPTPEVLARAAYIALYSGDDERALQLVGRWYDEGYGPDVSIDRIRLLAGLHLRDMETVISATDALLISDGRVNGSMLATISHILGRETTPAFALEVTRRLNQKYTAMPLLMLLQSRLEASMKNYHPALLRINELIELDPNLMDAYLIKAQILAGMNRQAEAIDAIEVVVNKRPDDQRLRLQFSRMLVQFKQFDKALRHFRLLHEVMPTDENVLLSLGLLSIEVGEYQQAKVYLQDLLDQGYHNQQAHYYLGRIQQNEGEDMPAIANYERVLDGEYWFDARIRSASLIARSGQFDKALVRLESLHREQHNETNRIKLYLAKGEVLREARRNHEAFDLYNDALQQIPESTELLYARALAAEKLDLLDITESDLKMVIMHEPENASALNALGYTLADRTHRYDEAREYILRAANLLPNDPAILDSLGWVHYRLGDYESAIKWLKKAFEVLEDAEIAAHLGEVLWVSGETEKARSIWKKGQLLDGNQSVLKDTIQRFK